MWGNDKRGGGAARPASSVESLIGQRTVIRGDIEFSGGLHVDGQVHGTLVAEPSGDGTLMLSDKGVIEGQVRAPHVVINGRITGDIYASERIELAANARVHGNIHYKVLEMAAGAQVTGQLVRTDEPLRQLPAPVAEATSEATSEAVAADVASESPPSRSANGKGRSAP
jgi:cytoskeletal protein CcmA (bactofilin family)